MCMGIHMGIHISWYLKEELAWAIDKLLQVISNIMLFKTVIPLRVFMFKTILDVLICGP